MKEANKLTFKFLNMFIFKKKQDILKKINDRPLSLTMN